MSNPRISISTLKQLIQLQSNQLTTRAIARALSLSQGAVSKYRRAVLAAGLTWEEALSLEEVELERRVWQAGRISATRNIAAPDCAWIHTQLKRHKHVTLQLLWEEYQATHGRTALRYSSFCERYRHWAKRLQRSMRQRHYAGEKLFVDYAGRTVPIYGVTCEEVFRAPLFVGALGASGYAYAEATRTASLPDWLGSHVRMLEYYGASPTILVPDNPRVGVTKADRYEPQLQRSYEEMAAHFGIAIIPARPFRPRDKPKAELTVLLVCRWVLARLRHQRFFSLEELNTAIRPLLQELNERAFQKLPGSRRSMFESLDRPAMRALPSTPYVYAEWKRVRAAFDYHVDVDRHYYSVPHALVGQELWARYSAATVEVFHRSQRVGSHPRSYQRGVHTTLPEHMPRAHRAHAEWTPTRLINWGASIGANTCAVVEHLLKSKSHPEQGYRACLGLLALARQYGQGRLEAASTLAVKLQSPTRKSVLSILKSGRDQHPAAAPEELDLPESARPKVLPLTSIIPICGASMLTQPTTETLRHLKLHGMAQALEEQREAPTTHALAFEERLALLVDRERLYRQNGRYRGLLREARLKVSQACIEDINYKTSRGLDKSQIAALADGAWIQRGQNLLITGPTGSGKTWIACALAHQACRQGLSGRYWRVPRLFEEIRTAHGDGSYLKILKRLAKSPVLVLDDWGLIALSTQDRADLLEILDDRLNARSTVLCSQLPVDKWHAYLGEPTLADAILDRLVHHSHRIELNTGGESMRKSSVPHNASAPPDASTETKKRK